MSRARLRLVLCCVLLSSAGALAPRSAEALFLGDAVQTIKDGVGDLARKAPEWTRATVDAFRSVGDRIGDTLGQLATRLPATVGALETLGGRFRDVLVPQLSALANAGIRHVGMLFRRLEGALGQAWQTATREAGWAIANATHGLIRSVESVYQKGMQAIRWYFDLAGRFYANVFADAWQTAANQVPELARRLAHAIDQGWAEIDRYLRPSEALLIKLAEPAWRIIKGLSCDDSLQYFASRTPIGKSSAAEMGNAWYAGQCAQEFVTGFVCALPDAVLDAQKLRVESARYAWRNRNICLTGAAAVSLYLPPLALPSIYYCGMAFYLADTAPKAVRCIVEMFTSTHHGADLKQALVGLGCNLAGSIAFDIVLAILTGGGSAATKSQSFVQKLKTIGNKSHRELLDKMMTLGAKQLGPDKLGERGACALPYERPPEGRGLRILTATYGGNCMARTGNVAAFVGAACNGRTTCNYAVQPVVVPGGTWCQKDFRVEYQCERNPVQRENLPGESQGKTITLSCASQVTVKPPPPDDPRPADDWVDAKRTLRALSATGMGRVAGIDPDGVLVTLAAGKWWVRLSGQRSLKQVAQGADGTLYGVGFDGAVYRYDQGRWIRVPGQLVQIAVGAAGDVWGVGAGQQIFRRAGSGWTRVPGPRLTQVAVGADGAVWGIDTTEDVHRHVGGRWLALGRRLRQIAVGSAAYVLGLDRSGRPVRWTGAGWVELPGSFSSVAVTAEGNAWALGAGGRVYRAPVPLPPAGVGGRGALAARRSRPDPSATAAGTTTPTGPPTAGTSTWTSSSG